MIYNIEYHKDVIKFFKKHKGDKKLRERFSKAINNIRHSPRTTELCDIKKMQGLENDYRLRIGKYRFIYEVKESDIIIYFYDANTRGDIYKR